MLIQIHLDSISLLEYTKYVSFWKKKRLKGEYSSFQPLFPFLFEQLSYILVVIDRNNFKNTMPPRATKRQHYQDEYTEESDEDLYKRRKVDKKEEEMTKEDFGRFVKLS